jgi:hypothetical protein
MVLSLIIVDLIVPAFQRSVARQMAVTRVEEVKSNNANLTVRDADSTLSACLSITIKILRWNLLNHYSIVP